MLTVHHLGISQSDRIVWLCEELEIPYDLVRYDRDPVTRLAPAEYKALHPFGTAPVIVDGDLVLGESGAIIEYIVGRYGEWRLAPRADDPDFADYLYWFHFANASMMPAAMIDIVIGMIGGTAEGVVAALRARGDRAFAMVEQRLGEVDYFAGDRFTAADIIMLFPLTTMRAFVPRDLSPYPNILAYLQRIGARPAYQRAMTKADPELPPMLT
ncbi:glutathione S-transferase family protein [Sphingomonas profundi]|uniref:glutathione S-transferase family protein n=1 Tax=Alterirhizorhabdus profundi TaxID=2681549 RepID=UPI0012E76AC5|nr:glutathione S-transferase [Sphingomonas profundi]